jgi:hypothetical protein
VILSVLKNDPKNTNSKFFKKFEIPKRVKSLKLLIIFL